MVNRLVWADALRGLLILLVVLGHSLQHGDYENRVAWNIIYSFHMAVFFTISGYVSYKENPSWTILPKRAKQLLLPFVSWSLLGLIIGNRLNLNSITEIILRPDNSYWFIYVLFVINLLFLIVNSLGKIIHNQNIALSICILSLVLIMVVTEFRIFGFQFISLYFGFYVLGYWLKKYSVQITPPNWGKYLFHVVICVLGLVWFALAIFWKMHEVPTPLQSFDFLPASILTYSYRYLTALVGSIFFIGLAMITMNNANNKIILWLVFLGKISLGIYIIHLFIGRWFGTWFVNLFPSETSILFVASDFLIKLMISILAVQVIEKIPYISLLFLGKQAKLK